MAHSTLMLKAIFRRFPKGKAPDAYYDYVRGSMSRAEFLYNPDIRDAAKHAANEARCAELGKTPPEQIDAWIASAVNGASDWVLIGGPPCQAYSLAGRSRLRPKDREAFEPDSKHFLSTEYLRIIQRFEPTVFVMENVKGMLNSRNSGARIFECILADLSKPRQGLSYRIRSLAVDEEELEPEDFAVAIGWRALRARAVEHWLNERATARQEAAAQAASLWRPLRVGPAAGGTLVPIIWHHFVR